MRAWCSDDSYIHRIVERIFLKERIKTRYGHQCITLTLNMNDSSWRLFQSLQIQAQTLGEKSAFDMILVQKRLFMEISSLYVLKLKPLA
ncbi:hypothetical protein RRG08_067308 [Elysia crispata]|uniref:Uncharacterized protein n=1 Tax=Elysia crispata TaxID=231223 RepID=A0AAE1DCL8_9GAST|nr:hypothetical protein RRG08_067308 [Elysia crispata]